MKRILDKDGIAMRRPVGFTNREDFVPETKDETGAISGTSAPLGRGYGRWKVGGGPGDLTQDPYSRGDQ